MPRFEILGDVQVDVAQLCDDGWSSLVKLELEMLRELTSDYSRKTPLQCHRAKLALEAKNSLSPRFKSLLQATTLGRSLWTSLKEAADAAISPSSLSNEVKERVEAIKKSDFEIHLNQSSSGKVLILVVSAHPILVPALLRTREALVQLPGSLDGDAEQDHGHLQRTIASVETLVKNHSGEAMQCLADCLVNFGRKP